MTTSSSTRTWSSWNLSFILMCFWSGNQRHLHVLLSSVNLCAVWFIIPASHWPSLCQMFFSLCLSVSMSFFHVSSRLSTSLWCQCLLCLCRSHLLLCLSICLSLSCSPSLSLCLAAAVETKHCQRLRVIFTNTHTPRAVCQRIHSNRGGVPKVNWGRRGGDFLSCRSPWRREMRGSLQTEWQRTRLMTSQRALTNLCSDWLRLWLTATAPQRTPNHWHATTYTHTNLQAAWIHAAGLQLTGRKFNLKHSDTEGQLVISRDTI